MPRVAFVYVSKLDSVAVREVFLALQSFGFRVSHIGKSDPPKRSKVSYEEAADFIVEGNGDATNWTFVRDKALAVNLDFQIHNDSRWGYSTVSLSYPERISDHMLCDELFRRLNAFACVSGSEGAGKDQSWAVRLIAPDCPESIAAVIRRDA